MIKLEISWRLDWVRLSQSRGVVYWLANFNCPCLDSGAIL